MAKTNVGKIQRQLSEVEKFIESILAKPMAPQIKKKILDELQHYKARLIARNGVEAGLTYLNLNQQKQQH